MYLRPVKLSLPELRQKGIHFMFKRKTTFCKSNLWAQLPKLILEEPVDQSGWELVHLGAEVQSGIRKIVNTQSSFLTYYFGLNWSEEPECNYYKLK